MKKMALVAALCAVLVAGCNNSSNVRARNEFRSEQNYVNGQLGLLRHAEPFPKLLDSADLRIQAENYTSESDPNKVWYVARTALDGTVIQTFTTRGPVEPASDQITNDKQVVCISGSTCNEVSLAEPNGVYQGPTDVKIAILTSGAVIRFTGDFVQSDQPFKITTQPKFSIDETAPITATDLSKTQGGVIPQRR